MKKTLLLITIVCSSSLAFSQSVKREVIGSTGSSATIKGTILVQETVGQAYQTQSHYDDRTSVRPGFIQPQGHVSVISDELNQGLTVKVFPNPTSQHIFIEVDELVEEANIQLMRTDGTLVDRFQEKNLSSYRYDCSALSSGTYFLKITDGKGKAHFSQLIVTH